MKELEEFLNSLNASKLEETNDFLDKLKKSSHEDEEESSLEPVQVQRPVPEILEQCPVTVPMTRPEPIVADISSQPSVSPNVQQDVEDNIEEGNLEEGAKDIEDFSHQEEDDEDSAVQRLNVAQAFQREPGTTT
ncbi:hypothetical protein O6H91_Y245500 [Diphasiastrum complanatum]|nr:hypothetical protein O6H91_Y245500 [Diphasiastrum complanatum]